MPDVDRVAEAARQVRPGDAGLELVEDGVDERAVARGGAAGVALLARQQVPDGFPLSIGEFVAATHADPP